MYALSQLLSRQKKKYSLFLVCASLDFWVPFTVWVPLAYPGLSLPNYKPVEPASSKDSATCCQWLRKEWVTSAITKWSFMCNAHNYSILILAYLPCIPFQVAIWKCTLMLCPQHAFFCFWFTVELFHLNIVVFLLTGTFFPLKGYFALMHCGTLLEQHSDATFLLNPLKEELKLCWVKCISFIEWQQQCYLRN